MDNKDERSALEQNSEKISKWLIIERIIHTVIIGAIIWVFVYGIMFSPYALFYKIQ
jgi:cytochrome b subunit of formate dehydrogenase